MNALDFLDFILEKHHEGVLVEPEEKDLTWEHKDWFRGLPDGCEWIEDVDK